MLRTAGFAHGAMTYPACRLLAQLRGAFRRTDDQDRKSSRATGLSQQDRSGDPSVCRRGKANSGLAGRCVSALKLGLGAFAICDCVESRQKLFLVPSPGVAKPDFGYNLRKAIRKFSTPISIERPCIHNSNPIVLGGSVNRESELGRPPIRLTLIDEGDQFRGCSLGPIDHRRTHSV